MKRNSGTYLCELRAFQYFNVYQIIAKYYMVARQIFINFLSANGAPTQIFGSLSQEKYSKNTL
jgi:hypothetical protein